MRVVETVRCELFPCLDVHHESYHVPAVELDLMSVRVMLIGDAAPADEADGYYGSVYGRYAKATVYALRMAGAAVATIDEIAALGVYMTTAVKCSKMAYAIQRVTVTECSRMLEQEIDLFPNLKAILLMGDVAVQALNRIARRRGYERFIPLGTTEQIRGGDYTCRGKRVFPTFLHTDPVVIADARKRAMIAEDIAAALAAAGVMVKVAA